MRLALGNQVCVDDVLQTAQQVVGGVVVERCVRWSDALRREQDLCFVGAAQPGVHQRIDIFGNLGVTA